MGGSTELTTVEETTGPSNADSPEPEGPTRDEIFDVLCNERRRYVLEYLRESPDEALHLGEMVDTIAAWENDKEPVETEYADRKRVYTALRQTHLPKLHETGMIEYDRRRGELRPTERMDDVQLYLDYVPEHEIPWGQYYLGLSLLAALLFFGSVLVGTTSGVVSLSTAAIVVAAFLVSSSVHTYRTRRNDVHRPSPET
ncbi:hypothetical protein [Halorubrum sp. F4]|uniref:DUF7344 domain-containing protein n=1 Tax=Halorubrum sp. F4 TaxID=2989715 RepID=UPI002480711C|nr:hypothetical protein [Halorubrum sp. F4]